jgi:hypothetical protein
MSPATCTHAPDIVGNIRIDQAWGLFQLSAAAHEVGGASPRASFWSLLFTYRQSRVRVSRINANDGKIERRVHAKANSPSRQSRSQCGPPAERVCEARPSARLDQTLALPWKTSCPVSLTTQTEVSFCETPSPTYSLMVVLPIV